MTINYQNYKILLIFFFFNDTATTEIYTLPLHDALPILDGGEPLGDELRPALDQARLCGAVGERLLRDLGVIGLVRRSEEHTSELQSQSNLVCRLLLEKKKIPDLDAVSSLATSITTTKLE